jgi:hypothetical protein
MNRDKQIEEMAEEILQEYTNCYSEVDQEHLEKMLSKFASDVAREIFEEIEKYLVTGSTFYGQAIHSIGVGTFANLKKKYIGEDTNVPTKESEGEG